MTDIEMDLMLAQAKIKHLEDKLAKANQTKCFLGSGVAIKPDGIHEVDPCLYEDVEIWHNVTVIVSRCKRCGHIELSWIKQDDTEGGVVDE